MPAPTTFDFKEPLARILPAPLDAALRPGRGLEILACLDAKGEPRGDGLPQAEKLVPVEWIVHELVRPSDAQIVWTCRSHRGDLELKVDLTIDTERRSARWSAVLHNGGKHVTVGFSGLHIISLGWTGIPWENVSMRSVGGGQALNYYPPASFEERTHVLRPGFGPTYPIASGDDGRSSNNVLPFLMVGMEKDGAVGGVVSALEWSGKWFQRLNLNGWWDQLLRRGEMTERGFALEAGIPVEKLVLAPGESLALPTAHVVFFEGSLDEGGNAFRRYVRDAILPPLENRKPLPPVVWNSWFGIHRDLSVDLLRRNVDRCVELGVEYFVLDAGWMAGGSPGVGFQTGVGNWERADPAIFPQGIEPVAQYARERGLKFGLWLDVEEAWPGTDLPRQHPDWFWEGATNRFLHLNLTLKPAQDYLIEMISRWIERLDLRWIRWDYNIGPAQPWSRADPTGKVQFAYMAGLYRVLDTLLARHPHLLLDCCASGGRRIDLGTLRRAHTAFLSDHTEDPHVCRFMQTGMNRVLPGVIGTLVLPVWIGEGDARYGDLDVISRMCGVLGFSGDVASWSRELTRRMRQRVDVYKRFRHLLNEDFFPLTPHPRRADEWDVAQFVHPAGHEAVVFAFRFRGTEDTGRFPLRGLDPKATYLVEDPLAGSSQREDGSELSRLGLSFQLGPDSAGIRLLKRVT